MSDDIRVNVFNPEGEIVSLPSNQLNQAYAQGFRPANDQDIKAYDNEQKYGTTGQQLIAAAEGLARGATLHASDVAETALGITTPEAIEGRKQANPVTAGLSEVGGLAGSLFLAPEMGAAKLLGSAGEAGAAAAGFGKVVQAERALGAARAAGTGVEAAQAGLEALPVFSRIGSTAVKGAIENAVYQGTDEMSKLFMGAPDSVETAISNVGLAGLLGGGISGTIGAVSPLWKATMGNKLGDFLGAMRRRMDGQMAPIPDAVREAMGTVGSEGMEFPEAVRGAIQSPELEKDFTRLMESQTAPGVRMQEEINGFRQKASAYIAKALGREPEDLLAKGQISHFENGSKVQGALVDQIQKTFEPIQEQYDKITKAFDDVPITAESDIVADKLGNLAETEKWNLLADSPQNKLFNSVMKGLPNVKTLEDLRRFQSNIWGMAKSDPGALFYPARKINDILDDVLNETYLTHAGAKGPEFLDKFTLAKEAYKSGKNLIEDLNSRLHVGRYSGPKTFIEGVKDMQPERLISRLSNANDAGLIKLLKTEFPQIAEMVRNYHLDKLAGGAVSKAGEGYALNNKVFFSALENLTPEMREFLLPEGAGKKLGAIKTLLDAVPTYPSSHTAGNLDKLWENLPGSASAGLAMLMGHNPVMGWVLGQAGRWAGREAPDAAKLAMLKFMGSDGPVEAEGFKAVLDFAHTMVKAENTFNGAVKSVFKAGKVILPEKMIPTEPQLKKLDERVKELQENPEGLLDTGGKTVTYAPDHAQHMATVAQNAVNVLNQMRPREDKQAPLDSKPQTSDFQKAQYNRALEIAQSPLSVLSSIKDGTIAPQDIAMFRQLYPSLYQRTTMKLMDAMAHHVAEGGSIPYHTRLGLSMFVGQPLDSTMTPQAILQAKMVQQPPLPFQMQGPKPGNSAGMQKMSKLPQMGMTQQQASTFRNLTTR